MLFSGKRTLKNIGGGLEGKIKELSDVLVERRKAFLEQARHALHSWSSLLIG